MVQTSFPLTHPHCNHCNVFRGADKIVQSTYSSHANTDTRCSHSTTCWFALVVQMSSTRTSAWKRREPSTYGIDCTLTLRILAQCHTALNTQILKKYAYMGKQPYSDKLQKIKTLHKAKRQNVLINACWVVLALVRGLFHSHPLDETSSDEKESA